MESDLSVLNVNSWELAKYVAVFCDQNEIVECGLSGMIPERKLKSRRQLTTKCLSNTAAKEGDIKWTQTQQPTREQLKKMWGMALSVAVKVVMTNHCYMMGDQFSKQSGGAPIGNTLACALHRPFMWSWDRKYLRAVERAGLMMCGYKRYVDDSSQLPKKRDNQSKEGLVEELLNIANSIEEDINMEGDTPWNHPNNQLPILDMSVWIDENGYAV